MTNEKKSIEAAKRGFEESFSDGEFYNKQTQDEEHLNAILEFLPIKSGMRILDLGAGSGYLSFAIAKKYHDVKLIGLDIVEKALESNRKKAIKAKLNNISFVNYDGTDFPFNDKSFDMVISRYALHHFPMITASIAEVSRVLKWDGYLFISDPAPNANDSQRFIDAYMQLKKDGHIKFYTSEEWINICEKSDLKPAGSFLSSIRFPKKKNTAYGFEELINKYNKEVVDGYSLEILEDEIYVTEQVNNLLFHKRQ
ncbi:MAG: class I SAM-dependent methyltransferase, partial [Candidatus Ornithomonoglobus sp.]